MAPIVDGLTNEFAGRATVLQLDAALAENEALMPQLGLRGHPTFAVLDASGRVTARYSGPQSAATLRDALAAVAQPLPPDASRAP